MPIAHQHGSASILESVDEMKRADVQGRPPIFPRARREYPKPAPDIRHRADTTTKQYSQTGTLGKAEGDIHRKNITCRIVNSRSAGGRHERICSRQRANDRPQRNDDDPAITHGSARISNSLPRTRERRTMRGLDFRNSNDFGASRSGRRLSLRRWLDNVRSADSTSNPHKRRKR